METRALTAQDFDQVVALDRRLTGRNRRDWFQRRLAAALRTPDRHLQLAIVDAGGLHGFVLARVVGGEYGRTEPAVVIEDISVDPEHRGHGLGRSLLDGLAERMARRGLVELQTQASWRDHGMLRFFDAAGFELSPRVCLQLPAVPRGYEDDDDEALEKEPLYIRTLAPADLTGIVAVDRRLSRGERAEYLSRKVDEALAESAIRVSLVAEEQGAIVGFLMARVDFGDFGRVVATAELDTLGVDPRFARKGYGQALLEQLLKNLQALGVETVQTEVDRGSFALLGWFYKMGFGPSPRLVFSKRVG